MLRLWLQVVRAEQSYSEQASIRFHPQPGGVQDSYFPAVVESKVLIWTTLYIRVRLSFAQVSPKFGFEILRVRTQVALKSRRNLGNL